MYGTNSVKEEVDDDDVDDDDDDDDVEDVTLGVFGLHS